MKPSRRACLQAAADAVERLAPLSWNDTPNGPGAAVNRFFTLITVAEEYGLTTTAIVDELARRRDTYLRSDATLKAEKS